MHNCPVSGHRAESRDSRGSNRPITTTERSGRPRAPPVFLYFTGDLRTRPDCRVAHALDASGGSPPSGSARRVPVSKECSFYRSGHGRRCILRSTATGSSSRTETGGGGEARRGYVCRTSADASASGVVSRFPMRRSSGLLHAYQSHSRRPLPMGTCWRRTGRPCVRAGRRWSAASPTLP